MRSSAATSGRFGAVRGVAARGLLSEGRERGLRFLLSHLRPDASGGASFLHSPTRARALETALTLHVLRRAGIEPAWQQRLRVWLMRHADGAESLSGCMARAVLGQALPQDVTTVLRALMVELEYGRRRKQALLLMLLVELGVLSLESAGVGPEDFAAQASHRFSQLYCAALRLMHRRHAHGEVGEGHADIAFLASHQASNGGWEQQALITLMAMMGMGSSHPAFWRGLEFLRGLERSDGGMPFIDDQDIFLTAVGGLALRASRSHAEAQQRVARFIVSRQHADGGWSFRDEVLQTDVDDASNCAQVLLQGDSPRFEPAITRALAFFQARQRGDGGYPTYEREGESEVTMTANVLLVQSLAVARRPELRPAMRHASRFLLERQKSDGRFEKSWSVCETYSLFRVMWALEAYQAVDDTLQADAARASALRYLLESQRMDGGWGRASAPASDALSTAYALAALCLLRLRLPVESWRLDRAAEYLLTQQDSATGEFVSVADVTGPRPFLFDVPLMSTAWCVLALSFVLDGPL